MLAGEGAANRIPPAAYYGVIETTSVDGVIGVSRALVYSGRLPLEARALQYIDARLTPLPSPLSHVLLLITEKLNTARIALRNANIQGESMGTAMTATPVVVRPILLAAVSVNQRAPSGPVPMPSGALPAVHRLPSDPAAIAIGPLKGVGIGNSVITPAVVIRPILLPSRSDRPAATAI